MNRSYFGWESPNEAATFIAMLCVVIWGGWFLMGAVRHGKSRYFGGVILGALEIGALLCLVLTASRSGVLAWGTAGVFILVTAWRLELTHLKNLSLQAGVRVLLALTGLFWLKAGERFAPEYLLVDRSGLFRIDLWRAGLRMLWLEPWTGWGVGQSGLNYMHWFQEPSDPGRVAGMIQSFLHIGVERGAPLLWLFTTVLLFLPIAGASFAGKAARDGKKFASVAALIAAAIGVVWLIGNLFSTQWIIRDLWIIPGVATLLLVLLGFFRENWRRRLGACFLAAGGLAALATGFTLLAGAWFPYRITVEADSHWVQVEDGEGRDGNIWYVFPDSEVLGRDYGRELRRWMQTGDIDALKVARHTGSMGSQSPYAKAVLAMGNRVNNGLLAGNEEILLVHPTVKPDPKAVEHAKIHEASVTLLLPDLEISGYEDIWRRTAKERGWIIIDTGWTGIDIRSKWPEVMNISPPDNQ